MNGEEVAAVGRQAGFEGEALVLFLAVTKAESGWNPAAVNVAGNSPPSRDRGLVQINDYWHPEVSDACAFDPACAAQACWTISSHGTRWSPWSAYNNGSYKRHMAEAEGIVAAHFVVSARNNVLEIARSQIGVTENPPHSNHVPYWDWYQPAYQGSAWCACFVSWCFDQAGVPLNIETPKGFIFVPAGVAWFRAHGQLRAWPEPGFIALYNAHTGIVEAVHPDGSFTAIEGNEGDRVMRVHRGLHDPVGVIGFGDPLYTDDEGEPEMTEAEWGRMTELIRTVVLDVVDKQSISGAADPRNPVVQAITVHGDASWRK